MNKFYRSSTNRRLSGICGGLANYTNSDPILWRLLFVIGFFIPSIPSLLIYLIFTLITESDESITDI